MEKLRTRFANHVNKHSYTGLEPLFDGLPGFLWKPLYPRWHYDEASGSTCTSSAQAARLLERHVHVPLHVRPVLQLVKVLCHALAVDHSVSEQVGELKRALLSSLQVNEFAPDAELMLPDVSASGDASDEAHVSGNHNHQTVNSTTLQIFRLGGFVCPNCLHAHELDLQRDLIFELVTDENGAERKQVVWRCNSCGEAFDKIGALMFPLYCVIFSSRSIYCVSSLHKTLLV